MSQEVGGRVSVWVPEGRREWVGERVRKGVGKSVSQEEVGE